MKQATSGLLKGRLLATSALVATALLVSPVARAGGPSGGSVAVGSATISAPTANKTVVDQSSNKALINWNSFSIPTGSSVVFNQPTANSLTVNRVTGPNASVIDGQMLANGNIWLLNSNGVLFGHGAQVNVGGLLATTSDITDEDFKKGRYRFAKPSSDNNAAVVNQGTIVAAKGGSVVLSASQVSNEGVIQADLGTVVLGGARTFTVDLDGDNLIRYQVGKPVAETPKDGKGAAPAALVSNSGTISADGGSVLITARAARNIENNVINNTGVVEANSVSAHNGEIVFDAGPDGTANVGGSVSASGSGQGETGGSISVTGGTVNVSDGATLNASGDRGGGTIQIGGGLHGQASIANAQSTNVGKASISADAVSQGDGGKISVWADGQTSFSGNASAKGGAQGGNGGLVETSGEKLHVGSDAKVDTSAAQGQTGTWLLDPTDIDIVSGGADGIGGANIDPSTIVSALGSTNVALQATHDITLDNNLTYSSANSLSLLAGHDIAFNASIQNSGNGGVVLSAHSISRSGNVSISAKSADITLTGDGSDGAAVGTSANPLQLSVQSLAVHTGGADAYIASLGSSVALGASDLGTGDLTLASSGAVTQTGALHMGALNVTAILGSVTLTNTGNAFDSLSLGLTSGSATIYDASNLTITSALIGGDLTVSGAGAIGQSGVIHSSGLTVSSTGGAIDLTNTGNTFALAKLTTTGAYDASVYDASAMTVLSANVGGKLTLSGGGTIQQTGAIHAGALSASSAGGTITLTHTANTFGDLSLATTGSNSASIYDDSDVNIVGATVGGALTLSSGGGINQTGALHATTLNITAKSGDIVLSNAANTFNTVTVATAGTDSASLADAAALNVASATVGGDLTLSGGSDITQSGAIHAASLTASTTAGSITLTNSSNMFATAALAATGNATIYQGDALVMASADVDGTLTLTSGSTIGQTGAIHAGTLNATTTNGAITLSNAANTIGTANLSTAGSDDAILNNASALTVASAAIGGNLTLSGASVSQSGAIHTHDLNVSATGGSITLTDTGNTFDTLTVGTSGAGNAALYDAQALSVTSANVGGALSLTSAGALGQSGAIRAASLNATTTNGAIALTNIGNSIGAASLTTSGSDNASLYDASNLTISGATVGGNLTLTGGGNIGQSAAIHALALSVTASNGSIALANSGNTFNTATLSASGDATLYDASALSVTSANAGGDLTLSGGASITQTGAIHADGLGVSTTGGAVTLTNAGNTFNTANVTTSGSYDATLYDASNLVVTGTNVGGTLTLTGGGSIGQSGAILAHALNVTTTHGAIDLGNSGNAFATATLSTSGTDDANLHDASALTIVSANIGGDLVLSGGASIAQSGAIHSATLNVSSTGGSVNLTNAGNNFGPVYVATGGTNDATLYNLPNLVVTGAAVGGTLTLSSGGSISQTGAIHAGGLNATTTNGSIVLSNTGNTFATAILSTSGSDDATLYDAANLIVTSATIGGDLALSVNGSLGQTGAIHAASLSATTAGGAISLTNTGNSFATASLTTGGADNASLYDAADLTVTSANIGGTLNLSGGGAIYQSGAIHAASLIAATTHGAIVLTNSANTVATATLSTSGTDNASFADASNLIVASANVGGTLTLSGGRSIGQTGAIHANALAVTTTNGAIVLTNTGNAFNTATLATSGTDDASLYDSQALTVASANIGGDLSLSGGGAIGQTGAIHAATLNVATTAGAIVLTNAGNSFGPATISTSGSNNATLYDAPNLTVASANVGGTLTLSSGGAIGQTGAIHASSLSATTTHGAITLTNTGNAFATATLATSGSDNASLYDSQGLTIASANIGGTLNLSGAGAIAQSGAIHAAALTAATTGGAITLTNSGNSFASASLTTTGTYNASLYDASGLTVTGATVGGTLNLSGGAAIGQSGAIHSSALNVTAAGAITLSNSGNTFATASLSTTNSATLYDASSLTVTGATVGGALTLSGGGSIGQSGAIQANTLGVTTTNGAITLTNTGNAFGAVTLATSGTDDASLYDSQALTIAGATIGGDLSLSGGASIGQTGAIHAATLTAATTNGAIVLMNTGNNFGSATISTSGSDNASLYDASDLSIASANVGGTLTLSSGGVIGQTGAIHAASLVASTTHGAITLTNAGNAVATAALSTAGSDNASFTDAANLIVASANVGGTLTLSGSGTIGQTGAIHAAALVVGTTGGDITLSNAGNTFAAATISTAGTDDATLYDASALTISSANVGGTLNLSAGGAIGQTGAILAAALDVAATGGDITLTNSANSFATASLSTAGTHNASLYDSADLTVSTADVGGMLSLSGGGAIGQTGAIHADALNVSTTAGDIVLNDSGNVFNTLSASTGGTDDASFHDSVAVAIVGADVGGILTVTGDSDISQSGAIHADALVASTTNGDIDLTDAGNSFADATLSATGDAALHDATALNIVNATVGGTLTLSGDAGITQTGTIDAATLNVSTTHGDIVLTNTGNSFDTASVATSGSDDASLYDASALTVSSANVGGALNLSAGGAIGQTGAIHAASLNATTTGGDITLSNVGNAFAAAALSTAGTDDATLYDAIALTISSANVGGTLNLSGGGAIGQSGAIHAAALNVGTTHGAIALTNSGNSFATATVSTGGSDDAALTDAAALTIASANVGGTLTLSGGGAIGQSGAIHAHALNAATTSGAIILTNTGNNFASAAMSTGGSDNASLYDAADLTVSSATVGGTLSLSGGGSIGQSGAIHAANLNVTTTHGAIALANTGNSFATATLSTAGTDNAALYDAAALTISSATIGGDLTLSGGGTIGQTGAIHAKALSASSTGGAIVLADTGNSFDTLSVSTSGTNGATFADGANLTVVSANVGGTLKLTANAIAQSGAIHAGALNVSATTGGINLGNSGNSFANAALTTTGSNNATVYDASALVIDDADVGGTLTLSGGGAISQIDAIHANVLNVTTSSGQISLTSANNAVNSASLSTPDSAWLYDASSLTLTNANVGGSLTILSQHDLTFVSDAQAKTGLLAVAGWNGTTVDPAALVAGTAYGNNSGDIVVGGSTAQGDVAVGSLGGTTTLAGNNITLSATNGYAQLGYHGAGTGALSVYAKGDVTLSGGAQTGRFAQIGNGGYQVSGNETGDIHISAAGNLALNAGSGQAAYAQVGHGGAQSNSSSHGYSDTGLVTINAKTVTVAAGAGTAAYAQIGHGGYLSGQSLLGGTATLGGNITVTTVSGIALTGNGTAAYAQIGHGGDLVNNNAANGTSGTISGDITASVSTKPSNPSIDPVTAIAGSGDESYAQIGNGGSGENTPASEATVNFTISGDLFVDDIRLRGSNSGARGYAQIGNGDAGKNGTGNVEGDITIGHGFHVDAVGGSADDTSAIIGNDTGFGTVTGLVTFLSEPNPPPPPPPPPPTVGSSGGAIAVVIQKPTENLGNISVVTVPVVNIPDINLTDTGGSNHGPGPLEQLVDSNSDGKSSEGEQASDSASESLGKSLDAGRKGASREIMPGLTRNMTQHPHAVPPADVDYSSWGNEAFWVW